MSSATPDVGVGGQFAIVPVKPLDEGKSRLRQILDRRQRAQLNAFLMQRTFERTIQFPGASRTIVVSRSESVLTAAAAQGLTTLRETADDLNTALDHATRKAISLEAEGVLILPVDLPMVSSGGIRREIRKGIGQVCLIAPDRHGRGTNFLYLSPPQTDFYRFGPDSFRHHQASAMARGLRVVLIDDESFTIDIDEPADYRLWQSRRPNWRPPETSKR